MMGFVGSGLGVGRSPGRTPGNGLGFVMGLVGFVPGSGLGRERSGRDGSGRASGSEGRVIGFISPGSLTGGLLIGFDGCTGLVIGDGREIFPGMPPKLGGLIEGLGRGFGRLTCGGLGFTLGMLGRAVGCGIGRGDGRGAGRAAGALGRAPPPPTLPTEGFAAKAPSAQITTSRLETAARFLRSCFFMAISPSSSRQPCRNLRPTSWAEGAYPPRFQSPLLGHPPQCDPCREW